MKQTMLTVSCGVISWPDVYMKTIFVSNKSGFVSYVIYSIFY